jgi:hypothetical protein
LSNANAPPVKGSATLPIRSSSQNNIKRAVSNATVSLLGTNQADRIDNSRRKKPYYNALQAFLPLSIFLRNYDRL